MYMYEGYIYFYSIFRCYVAEGSLHSTSAVTEGLFQLMDCVALAKRKQRTSQVNGYFS